jgi:argininosuccinate lyase
MYQATADVLEALVFYPDRALERVNEDYGTTTELADELQRDENVPFRVGHHFASELVTFGRANNLKPAQLPYAEAQRIYAKAARDFHLSQTELPLSETQFRRALTAENMVQAAEPLGGPQPAEVERMLAAERQRLTDDRAWLAATRSKLEKAAQERDAALANLMRQVLSATGRRVSGRRLESPVESVCWGSDECVLRADGGGFKPP